MSEMNELIKLSAFEAVNKLKSGEISPLELIDAAVERMDQVDDVVNAVPTKCVERARGHAKQILENKSGDTDKHTTWLSGLPVLIKDLNEVKDVRTTFGSRIFENYIPKRSDIMVERLEARGGVVLGKTNTPEFGAGAHTFNEVFGKTLNPYDLTKTCGGSSGGSAVALATGTAWLASGSDLGGSLRTPASFCNIVGFRPSPGRVAQGPAADPFDTLAVEGPMARNVKDVALFLDAMSGGHPEDPISLPMARRSFVDAVDNARPAKRIAFTPDLGAMPVDPRTVAACRKAIGIFEDMGTEVVEDCPNFSDAQQIFQTLRAAKYVVGQASNYANHKDKLKDDVIWNIEKGMALTASEIGDAIRGRAALYAQMAKFFEKYDYLICPAAIVPPFDVNQRYVDEVNGVKFDNYIDWVGIASFITLTSCPAISVPCGMTDDGLPVGLQIVGPNHGDGAVLAIAHLFEHSNGLSKFPINPKATNRKNRS